MKQPALLFHVIGIIGTLCSLCPEVLMSQTAAPRAEFEVVSVKPSEPFTPGLAQSPRFHIGTKVSGTRVDIGRMRLIDLIAQAYGLRQNQIVGPSWLTAAQEAFDVVARMPPEATREQLPQMMQAMLVERFGLAAHKETRDLAGYALLTAKDGPKLTAAEPEAEPAAASAPARRTLSANGRGGGTPSRQSFTESFDGTTTRYVNPRIDMARLVAMLEPIVDRPVVDMTGLAGLYRIALDISVADMRRMLGVPPGMGGSSGVASPADLASEPAGRSVSTSLRAMGLRLEPRRIPMQVVVVDHVEPRPTAN
jgi:uncharacterized protein (TIGR03435 family)